ncbi:MAG: hypothetical protein MZW92_36865 [Comamonadaceae bacterium]|nr:hypothetical protein [Comamonadaceae bacterium]
MRLFDPTALPVLADTALAIEEWRSNEDAVDAHLLAETLVRDPLMTLKLFAHVARHVRRSSRWDEQRGEAETVTAALVMLGIGPFFRSFGPQLTAEDTAGRGRLPGAGGLPGGAAAFAPGRGLRARIRGAPDGPRRRGHPRGRAAARLRRAAAVVAMRLRWRQAIARAPGAGPGLAQRPRCSASC